MSATCPHAIPLDLGCLDCGNTVLVCGGAHSELSLPAPTRSSSDNQRDCLAVPIDFGEPLLAADIARAFRGTHPEREPHVRRSRVDGALHITDGAVLTMRDRSLAAHRQARATICAPFVAKAVAMRRRLGL